MVEAVKIIPAQKEYIKQGGCGRRHVGSLPGAVAAPPVRPVISR
jgi:hypothetical protein